MRLALQTDYALRVLMYLTGENRRGTVTKISEFFEISRDHVAKVTVRLAKLGYIRAIRGAGGGLEMAQTPETIRIGEVIADFEGSMQLLDCVEAQTEVCRIQSRCKLKHVLAKAEQVQREYLDNIRLSDVVQSGTSLSKLTK